MINDEWLNRWNDRYRHSEYAYGVDPNNFLKDQLRVLEPGKALFAAEGEGRNAVFAATQGWDVYAFDISDEGRRKALQLAEKNQVSLEYLVGQLPDLDYQAASFDALILIFAHFPASIKSEYHQKLVKLLKPGGVVIFEAYSKDHLAFRTANPAVGGPANIEDLFSIEELQHDFEGFSFDFITEEMIQLHEGLYHQGTGCVIHFMAKKQ